MTTKWLARRGMAVAAMCACCAAGALGAPPQDWTAEALVKRVQDARRTTGFRMRASLTVTDAGGRQRSTRQIYARGRRDGESTQTLFQCLWPLSLKGNMVLLSRAADGRVTIFTFMPPDQLTRLERKDLAQPLFGSGLVMEDLSDDYLDWKAARIPGERTIAGRVCIGIEFKRPAGSASATRVVTAWISPDMALPLEVEKKDAEGRVVKRFRAEDFIFRKKKYWAARTLIVEIPGTSARTTLLITRGARDIDIPAEDFTLEGMKRLAQERVPQQSDAGEIWDD